MNYILDLKLINFTKGIIESIMGPARADLDIKKNIKTREFFSL